MRDVERLIVWQRSRDLIRSTYAATKSLPRDERYGIMSQMRRAAVSVMSNIAEGAGRGTDGEFARFLRIALGSATELWSLTFAAEDLGLADTPLWIEVRDESTEMRKMLNSLVTAVSG